jgi:hypothetical protein
MPVARAAAYPLTEALLCAQREPSRDPPLLGLALVLGPLRGQRRLLRPPSRLLVVLRGRHGGRVADLDGRRQAQRNPAGAAEAGSPDKHAASARA